MRLLKPLMMILQKKRQAGSFKTEVNIGPVMPPQGKGRLPQYSPNQLELLQAQFNELESIGIYIQQT